MKLLLFLAVWIRRLPLLFTLLLVASMLVTLILVWRVVKLLGVSAIADILWQLLLLVGLPTFLVDLSQLALVKIFWEALVVVVILLVSILLSYNLSAWSYRHLRLKPKGVIVKVIPPTWGEGTRLDRFQKIGIILAGGGAKGAYQAGGLKAIHEFLAENNALSKVKMIAGTSIGSWNALFWLAGLVRAPQGNSMSFHEQWWRSIAVSHLVEFDTYWPMRCNHFLLPAPWQEGFRRIFVEPAAVRQQLEPLFVSPAGGADPPVHFYLTRSNVETGQLEFSTNWGGIRDLKRVNPHTGKDELVVPPDRYEVVEGGNIEEALRLTERAVFASMDLPPLFPYTRIRVHQERVEWFEDGGVIENVPLWFGTQVEQCDLLFVLPLNADFSEPVNQTSLTHRLLRVLDVRQGVIERNAFKMAYLYNELAALRNRAQPAREEPAGSAPTDAGARLEATALRRRHRPLSLFAICPEQPLLIGTGEFWKPREAGEAFSLMYTETKHELETCFEDDTDPSWIRMRLVSEGRPPRYLESF